MNTKATNFGAKIDAQFVQQVLGTLPQMRQATHEQKMAFNLEFLSEVNAMFMYVSDLYYLNWKSEGYYLFGVQMGRETTAFKKAIRHSAAYKEVDLTLSLSHNGYTLFVYAHEVEVAGQIVELLEDPKEGAEQNGE